MLKKTKLHAYKFLSKTRNNYEKTENCQDMALIPKGEADGSLGEFKAC